jgi:hypothetical protein
MSKFLFLLEYNDYINSVVNHNESKYSDEYIYEYMVKQQRNGILTYNEGLIYSQPIDTTIKILKNKFKELEIKKYEDGDISIQGMNDKLKKYLPLINNLGYFISSAFRGDDSIDISQLEKQYLEEVVCSNIFIEPKYDHLVEIPNILYHASPLKFKDKILKTGLTPKSGSKLSYHPDRIYLSSNIKSCINFGEYLLNSKENKYYKSGYCIYKIEGKGIDKLYSDINMREAGFYTLSNIKKEFISLFNEVIKNK